MLNELTLNAPLCGQCFGVSVEEHLKNRFPLLRSKIRRLPPVHQATLKVILEHLARVASHSATNKMDVRNLAIVFGAVIFGEDELPKNSDVLSMAAWKVCSYHYRAAKFLQPHPLARRTPLWKTSSRM
jgi:hypothetical protein